MTADPIQANNDAAAHAGRRLGISRFPAWFLCQAVRLARGRANGGVAASLECAQRRRRSSRAGAFESPVQVLRGLSLAGLLSCQVLCLSLHTVALGLLPCCRPISYVAAQPRSCVLHKPHGSAGIVAAFRSSSFYHFSSCLSGKERSSSGKRMHLSQKASQALEMCLRPSREGAQL